MQFQRKKFICSIPDFTCIFDYMNVTCLFSFNYLLAYISSTKSRNSILCIQVAGYFTYGVMAISVSTFTFWSVLGPQILPAAVYQGSAVSLALQLACSVLVCFSNTHFIPYYKTRLRLRFVSLLNTGPFQNSTCINDFFTKMAIGECKLFFCFMISIITRVIMEK
jgi:hypothetical protein